MSEMRRGNHACRCPPRALIPGPAVTSFNSVGYSETLKSDAASTVSPSDAAALFGLMFEGRVSRWRGGAAGALVR